MARALELEHSAPAKTPAQIFLLFSFSFCVCVEQTNKQKNLTRVTLCRVPTSAEAQQSSLIQSSLL